MPKPSQYAPPYQPHSETHKDNKKRKGWSVVDWLVTWREKNFCQSSNPGFRARHSTETAILKVLSDILTATDLGKVSILGLLDMSAAFDTVDHSILFDRLEIAYGLSGTVLFWMRSFLTDRDQRVVFGGSSSATSFVKFGVPQGSVLGPLLFVLYTADIQHIAEGFNLGVHCYADDGQLYLYDRVQALPWYPKSCHV